MSEARCHAEREVAVPNPEGLHARPVMRFVERAMTFQCSVSVRNVTRDGECVDGKSAMQMMLLEATQGCVLRIETDGADAPEAIEALVALVKAGFDTDPLQSQRPTDPST